MGRFISIISKTKAAFLGAGFLEKSLEPAFLAGDALRQTGQGDRDQPGIDRCDGHGRVEFAVAPQVRAVEDPA